MFGLLPRELKKFILYGWFSDELCYLRFVCHEWNTIIGSGFKDYGMAAIAAGDGHFELLKWLHFKGAKMDNVCLEATSSGHLDIIKFGIAYTNDFIFNMCLLEAIKQNHLHIIKWLTPNGLGMFTSLVARDFQIYLTKAIEKGHIEILEWVRSLGIKFQPSWYKWAKKQQIVLEYFYNTVRLPFPYKLWKYILTGGSLETFKWVWERDTSSKTLFYFEAIHSWYECRLDLMHYVHTHPNPNFRIECTMRDCEDAKRANYLNVLDWARVNVKDWNEDRIASIPLYEDLHTGSDSD